VIHNYSFAILFGVLDGTYSSIFIAAPILDYTGIKRDWSEPAARPQGAKAQL
jgi:preprotein translocase subunit SecF